jgi:hypothetical protein
MRLVRIGAIAAFALSGWAAAAVTNAVPAKACPIAPATFTCAPDLLTVSPSATFYPGAQKSGTIVPNPATFTADYTENVYRDPTNNLCNSPGNCLTWVVQVTNHTATQDTLTRVTVSNFSGFITDLGYIQPPGTAPGMSNPSTGIVPSNVERSNNGSVLRWDFNTTEIGNGQTTVLLAVLTNATQVVPGTISVQDGTAVSDPAFAPALPEIPWVPALGLFGGAIAGGVLMRRGRRPRTA